MLEIKNIVREMKDAFDGLINRLDTAKEGISELEDQSIETFQTELQREKIIIIKQTEHPESVGQYTKLQHMCSWNARRGREKRKEILEVITVENVAKLMTDTELQIQEAQR